MQDSLDSNMTLLNESNNLLLPNQIKNGFTTTFNQARLQESVITLNKKEFNIRKVNPFVDSDLVNYYAILQAHASTLLNKATLNGKTIAERILQIEKNNLNGLTLKEHQVKYKINNQNRFKELHQVKFLKLEKVKKQFYKQHLNSDLQLIGQEQTKTLKELLQYALQGNLTRQNIGMFFVEDTKGTYISKNGNVKNKIAGTFGMVVQGVNQENKITKVELVNHLKEEYTGLGLGNELIGKLSRESLLPAIANNEFSNNARYVIETIHTNQASLRAQESSVGLTWFEKLTGGTLTTEEIPGSRIVKQENSITSLGNKFKIKNTLEDIKNFVSCQSR